MKDSLSVKDLLSLTVSMDSSYVSTGPLGENHRTQETWPPNSCKSWAGSFHYLTTYPTIFKKLFLPRYPGCVQWKLSHPTALPLMKRKSRLTLPSVCLLLQGHLVSCSPYSLASEVCLFNLEHGEKEGCQRGNGPLSSFCWASCLQCALVQG